MYICIGYRYYYHHRRRTLPSLPLFSMLLSLFLHTHGLGLTVFVCVVNENWKFTRFDGEFS